jgi:hypothetical protein
MNPTKVISISCVQLISSCQYGEMKDELLLDKIIYIRLRMNIYVGFYGKIENMSLKLQEDLLFEMKNSRQSTVKMEIWFNV